MPHLYIIPIVEIGKNTLKPSTVQANDFHCFFKQANDTMATPPPLPLIIGDISD
jgi:hypothetical protein